METYGNLDPLTPTGFINNTVLFLTLPLTEDPGTDGRRDHKG